MMGFVNSIEESDILKIVREDVLRILGERKAKVSLKVIKAKAKVSSSFLSRTIRDLEEENLIHVKNKSIGLTKKGRDEANIIVKKHLVLENYFGETRSKSEAHKAAQLLEHYVSEEVINNIKKLSTFRKEGVPLTKINLNKGGIITDIAFSDYGLFERIVSMGLFLGEKITVTNEKPQCNIALGQNLYHFFSRFHRSNFGLVIRDIAFNRIPEHKETEKQRSRRGKRLLAESDSTTAST